MALRDDTSSQARICGTACARRLVGSDARSNQDD